MTTACTPGAQAAGCGDMDDTMDDERDVAPPSTLPEQSPKTNNNNLSEPNELNNNVQKQNAAKKPSVQTFSQIRSVARKTRLLTSMCIGLYLLAFLLLLVLSLQHIVRNMDLIHDSVAEMIETWLLW